MWIMQRGSKMEYAVFKQALAEANNMNKFKLINQEINMTCRAIGFYRFINQE